MAVMSALKVLAIAEAEVGYLEKASNKDLDDKTANAGSNNYTKYARDLDAIPHFYNFAKQGYAWCDIFVDWLFVQAFGVAAAKKLLCQPDDSYGAGCLFSSRYYKWNNQFYTSDPKPGDQIFFWNSAKNDVAHTGIVYKVDDTYVYTIEGNTSSATGVVANGGGVWKKKYKLTYDRIYGYGRPAYDVEPIKSVKTSSVMLPVLKAGANGPAVEALQTLLKLRGYPCGKYGPNKDGVDGDFGNGTGDALEKFQTAYKLTVDRTAGPQVWGALVGSIE